jgi:cell division protein FtsB
MTAPAGESAQSGAEGTQSGAGDPTGNGSQGTGTSGEGTQSGAPETQPTSAAEVARIAADLEKQQARTQAADKRAAEAEAKLRQLVDKDLPEQAKLTRDLAESQKQVETLTARTNQMALENAFLKDNTYSWHNPERALKLVDLSKVEIDADGNVSGLKDALKALATSDTYLVKQEAAGGEGEPNTTPPATSPGTNGASGTGRASDKTLATRFPGLNTRRR